MDALMNLHVWKRSCRLSADLYKVKADCKEYGFREQLTRADLSIASKYCRGV